LTSLTLAASNTMIRIFRAAFVRSARSDASARRADRAEGRRDEKLEHLECFSHAVRDDIAAQRETGIDPDAELVCR
jgi:hypothetical protein